MLEYTISIAYDKNVRNVKEMILSVLGVNEKILTSPEMTVFEKELGDNLMVLTVRAWTKREH